MLLTPLIKRQLRIFAVLASIAVGLAFFNYAKVPAMVGIGVYDVTVDFADASGLYPKASVTYRGVRVGVVSDLQVSDDGAVATLRINNGADVPEGSRAELHSTSAIGEQYVDLVPPAAGKGEGDVLAHGAQIPRDRAIEMPQITPVLDSVNRLLESVPKQKTQRVLDQLDDGLGGSGPELSELVDASGKLLSEAQSQIDATTSLISALQPVLGTQRDLAAQTQGYAEALNDVTGSLATGDSAALRALLKDAPGGLDAAKKTVQDLQPTLPLLLANLTTNAQVLNTYLPELRQTLVVYPATIARVQSTVNPRAAEGDVQLDLRAAINNPPSCLKGYLPVEERRSPRVTNTRKVDELSHCDIAPESPTAVRGARNLPCPQGDGRGALPAACGLTFGSGMWPDSRGTVAYDLAIGQGGETDTLDLAAGDESQGDELWKILLLAPLTTR